MRRVVRLTFALLLIVLPVGLACAGTLTIEPVAVAAFEDDGTFTQLPMFPTDPVLDRSIIYQVDLYFTVSDLTPNERGFLSLNFKIDFEGFDSAKATDYSPDFSNLDSNGGDPGGIVPKYLSNEDIAPPGSDYLLIVASIAPGLSNPVDPRVTLGQGAPALLGSLFMGTEPGGLGHLMIKEVAASFNLVSGTPASSPQASVHFDVHPFIPEPSALSMAAVGLVSFLATTRRR